MSESPNSVRTFDLTPRSVEVLTTQQLDPLTTNLVTAPVANLSAKAGGSNRPTGAPTTTAGSVSGASVPSTHMALQLASRYGASVGRIHYHNDYGSNESRYDARAIQRQAIEV